MEKVKKEKFSAEMESFYYTDNADQVNYPMLLHKHEELVEILYVFSGHVKYRVGDDLYDLQPGNVVLIDRNVCHGEEPFLDDQHITFSCEVKNVRVDQNPVSVLMNGKKSMIFQFDSGSFVEKILLELQKLCNRQGMNKKEMNQQKCNELCGELLNALYESQVQNQGQEAVLSTNKYHHESYVNEIVAYLDENYREVDDLKELSKHFCLSQYYLLHMFKNEMNISPMKYVLQRKIGEVQKLLINTDEKISKISDETGFNSYCHLHTMFKRYIGITPKEYRMHYKNQIQAG